MVKNLQAMQKLQELRVQFFCLEDLLEEGMANSVQFSSVTQLCPTLGDPMDCSTAGFPVHHQLPELDVHQVSDAIQPSHPLSSPSPPAFSLTQQ